MSKHFSDSEFKKCVPSCSIGDMNANTLARLDTARDPEFLSFSIPHTDPRRTTGRKGAAVPARIRWAGRSISGAIRMETGLGSFKP